MTSLTKGQKISLSKRGVPLSPEHKKKIGNAHRGRKLPIEHRKKISESLKEEKHPRWKGQNVGYRALHRWVEKILGKAKRCVLCGLIKKPNGMKRYFQWANISREYRRIPEDWMQLCVKCHKFYDSFT